MENSADRPAMDLEQAAVAAAREQREARRRKESQVHKPAKPTKQPMKFPTIGLTGRHAFGRIGKQQNALAARRRKNRVAAKSRRANRA